MDLKRFLTEDDAVSPVIGVILMVAITVILAAVIGAFVLDLGGSQEKTPNAKWNFDGSAGSTYEITHQGGDQIKIANVQVNVAGSEDTGGSWSTGTDITAGVSYTTGSSANSGEKIEIIYTKGDNSAIIGSYEVP